MGHKNTPWEDWQIETLKTRRAEGWSASQIAAVIGLSRNAVIGKMDRLGLPKLERKPPSVAWAARCARRRAKAPPPKPEPRPKPWRSRPMEPLPPVKMGAAIGGPAPGCVNLSRRSGAPNAILHRRHIECAWPIGDVVSDNFHFCCAMVAEIGKPYCPEHMEMAKP
jgi:GcrA cell cycle regulator